MLFLHNVNFVISFAQFAHVSPLFNHTPSIKGDPSIKVSEQRQPWLSKFPISVPTAPKNPIRTQRPVSRETKYLALHPDNPLFCCMTHTTPRCENKNLGFLAAFFAIADSFPSFAKRKGAAPQLICCDSGPQFAPLRPATIRNRKKLHSGHIFVFRPLGQPQDGAIGEKPQEWQLGITLYSTRNRAVRTRRIFICAVLIAVDTLNQKGWTIHRPAF